MDTPRASLPEGGERGSPLPADAEVRATDDLDVIARGEGGDEERGTPSSGRNEGDGAFAAMANDAPNHRSGDGDSLFQKARKDTGDEEEELFESDSSEAVRAEGEASDEAGGEENHDGAHEDNDSDEDGEEKEELWDLKMVLKAKQILQANPLLCATPGCGFVACSIWSSSLDPEEPWYTCLDCQENDFGGWPSKESGDLPIKVLEDDLREAILEKCTRLDDPAMPDLPRSGSAATNESDETKDDRSCSSDAGVPDENEDGGIQGNDSTTKDDEGEETWELKKVFGAKDLNKSKPVICNADDCGLLACSQWVSNGPKQPAWFSCLDCQESDFGGWPEAESGELPIQFLTEEDRRIIADKCSNQENPTMPDVAVSMHLLVTAGDKKGDNLSFAITPPPSHDRAVAENQSEVVVGMARGKGSSKKKAPKCGVTPSPMPPKGTPKHAAATIAKKSGTNPISAKALETHRRWQAEADKMGAGTKIVCSKPDAKKLIFDKLHDDFRPMNINGIHVALKAVVPSAVLKSCLDDMLDKSTGNPFAEDSDNDEGSATSKMTSKKDSTDGHADSLRLKEGRNIHNNLYYVDYSKLSNNGDGLLPEARNELLSDLQGSNAEKLSQELKLKQTTSEAAQVQSEPKNEQLILEVTDLEKQTEEMNNSLEEARSHAGNEKYVKLVKEEIANKGAVWRKRKRQCIEFFLMMEESTEGIIRHVAYDDQSYQAILFALTYPYHNIVLNFTTFVLISLKKCLKGDGPIDIDSDEAAIEGAIAFAKRKRPRVALAGRRGLKGKGDAEEDGFCADVSFIGVTLGAHGKPERVYSNKERA